MPRRAGVVGYNTGHEVQGKRVRERERAVGRGGRGKGSGRVFDQARLYRASIRAFIS